MIQDKDKIRRVVNLCVLFTRNMAYYKAFYESVSGNYHQSDFIVTTHGNFIDIAILEWCKLFGSYKDHHHWKNIIEENHSEFSKNLFERISMNKSDFEAYHESMKNYRDVFAAHWDDDGKGKIPSLDTAFECVKFLHSHIFSSLSGSDFLQDKVKDLSAYYSQCFNEAQVSYKNLIV